MCGPRLNRCGIRRRRNRPRGNEMDRMRLCWLMNTWNRRMQTLKFILTITSAHAFALAALAAPGQSPDKQGLMELALDEPARITLEKVRLKDAIQQVWDQTGVKIVMPQEAMDIVPYGEETVVELVDIADTPLRDGLTQLFAPLGMTFVVRGDFVEVVPKKPLRCLGRRASWNELDTLTELSAMQPGVDPEALSRLRGRIQFKVPVLDGWQTLSMAIKSIGAGPGDEVLSVACANLGWAWCLSDRWVVVSSGSSLIGRQLKKPISLRMNSKALIEVLQEVGRKAGVPVRAEPGALISLPLQLQHSFSLNVHQKPVEEVLDAISAYTGLGYLIEPDGVLFYKANGGSAAEDRGGPASQAASRRDPYIAKIMVPLEDGTTVEWLIRRSELPPDLRERRAEDLNIAFEQLRRQRTDQRP